MIVCIRCVSDMRLRRPPLSLGLACMHMSVTQSVGQSRPMAGHRLSFHKLLTHGPSQQDRLSSRCSPTQSCCCGLNHQTCVCAQLRLALDRQFVWYTPYCAVYRLAQARARPPLGTEFRFRLAAVGGWGLTNVVFSRGARKRCGTLACYARCALVGSLSRLPRKSLHTTPHNERDALDAAGFWRRRSMLCNDTGDTSQQAEATTTRSAFCM